MPAEAPGTPRRNLIVGDERDFIDAGGGVEHAGRVGGVDLERGVVGGDERPGAGFEEEAGHGDRQRGAFFRIGGRSPARRAAPASAGPASRERRSRLVMCAEKVESAASMDCASPMSARNACEDGEAGRGGGNGQAGLGHHGQQGHGLERDGFTAGVGAADDELAVFRGQLERKRNDAGVGPHAAGAQAFLEQRMAGRFEAQQIGRDGWGNAVVVAGKAGARQQAVDQCENAGAIDERRGVGADLAGEGDEDAMDLGLFFFEEADQFVVLLDGFEGLDIHGLARRAGAVHHAADAALELAAHGDDEAVAANGDDVFLRGAFGGKLAQGGAERLLDDAALAVLVAADAAQFGRGVVGERAVGLDLALDGFGQRTQAAGEIRRKARSSPGSRPATRGGGSRSSDCQEAMSWARRATACSSVASRATSGMRALSASWVGSKRPPRGMEICSSSRRRTSPVS